MKSDEKKKIEAVNKALFSAYSHLMAVERKILGEDDALQLHHLEAAREAGGDLCEVARLWAKAVERAAHLLYHEICLTEEQKQGLLKSIFEEGDAE
jgi:hypothetical protein